MSDQHIQPQDFTKVLKNEGFDFFTGVPDSLLKELCSCISDTVPEERHIIAANEGGAVSLAAGYHLATGKAGVVYLQNSGTGHAVNPLLSLADPEVYAIPMLLIIGWRGEPGVKDEPQHVKQGRVQEALLESIEFPYQILSEEYSAAEKQLGELTRTMWEQSTPVVLLVGKNTFGPYHPEPDGLGHQQPQASPSYTMKREQALELILDKLGANDRIVSTTGKTSREIYEIREARGQGHALDFLTVGSMGHSSMIALGLAKYMDSSTAPGRRIVCIDGDGAALMHMGSMAIFARYAPDNLYHIVINNGSHDSVGGQETIGFGLPFSSLAEELNYTAAFYAETEEQLQSAVTELFNAKGPAFLEIRASKGARKDLGRPKTSPRENKKALMEEL